VVDERAERLGPQSDLRRQRPFPIEIERAHAASVDAAHTVDRYVLDEPLLLDEM
jgi:hypothetical protein